MIKNPIQEVTNKLQYRAIGIVKGVYKPNDAEKLNRGTLTDKEGKIIDTVVLGKALSLLKKYINLERNYFWIVYPRNKSTNNLHLQVAGIWDPYQLNQVDISDSEKDPNDLLDELNLNNNYFSIRGELVYVNTQKKEIVIKICSSPRSKRSKNTTFKIIIEGEIPLQFLNNFISLDVTRDGNTLRMVKYEVIEKIKSKKV
ncbi:conserved hypothetical protein [Prochlorococcus marinus str. MIT 9515]|uniref:Uncharacterized protein n=1 Tax=Prochlorococcus marinus (strain MIT 9515) TaxID=167542 RepID=A2BVE8_PROM5|nr:hypothetical protein [Prochlorococcus marinus]ABM71759.1 conserved hypothetical protein [Prochlorococcus marinus str. MIT 9515]